MLSNDETLDVKENEHHNGVIVTDQMRWRIQLGMLSNDSTRRKNITDGVIVTDQMRKYSEERRNLSGLHLLSIHDQNPL